MTEDEVRALLAVAMSYDNRRPGVAAVKAWAESARLGRWTLQAATAAVVWHYTHSTEFCMPAHITRIIRQQREDEAMRALEPAPVTRDPVAAARHRTIVDFAMGWRRDAGPRRSPLSVGCPHCHVGPGHPCTRPVGSRLARTDPHPSRVDAAQAQEESA